MTNPNDPAFDCFISEVTWDKSEKPSITHPPLTKREYFAAMAMQGLCSNEKWAQTIYDDWDEFTKRLSISSVDISDALIKALNDTDTTHP